MDATCTIAEADTRLSDTVFGPEQDHHRVGLSCLRPARVHALLNQRISAMRCTCNDWPLRDGMCHGLQARSKTQSKRPLEGQ